jgi:2-dehydro-3-deoxyphosphooctonate aldolase (KDO 8-P synthase)
MVPVLARAAWPWAWRACSWKPTPTRRGLVDGPNAVPLKHMKALLETLVALDRVTKKNGFLENNFGA